MKTTTGTSSAHEVASPDQASTNSTTAPATVVPRATLSRASERRRAASVCRRCSNRCAYSSAGLSDMPNYGAGVRLFEVRRHPWFSGYG